jgi:DHA1 family inner membrane transport protein
LTVKSIISKKKGIIVDDKPDAEEEYPQTSLYNKTEKPPGNEAPGGCSSLSHSAGDLEHDIEKQFVQKIKKIIVIISIVLGGFVFGAEMYVTIALKDLIDPNFAPNVLNVFSIGSVLGILLIPAIADKISYKYLVLILMLVVGFSNLFVAFSTNHSLILIGRFISGLPFGAFSASAGYLAADIFGKKNIGKAMSLPVIGVALSNLVGVPLFAVLANRSHNFQEAYLPIAILSFFVFVLILLFSKNVQHKTKVSIADEYAGFKKPSFYAATIFGLIGFTIYFVIYANILNISTNLGSFTNDQYPTLLFVVGLGLIVGPTLGGVIADKNLKNSMFIISIGTIVISLFILFTYKANILFIIGLFLFAAITHLITPVCINMLIKASPESPIMDPSMPQLIASIAVIVEQYILIFYGIITHTPGGGDLAYSSMVITPILAVLLLIAAFLCSNLLFKKSEKKLSE